ncbi:hypothetical protein pipiens_012759 [Culex pipiens pipiens]|uniref:Uncharacterized protein n=1 Tax=Culex pipiens pipiens TaxID=38569 RepID=A0ABD1D130_CULPP
MGVGFPLQNLITQGKRDDTGRILQHPVQVLLNECGICAAPTSTFSPIATPVICTTTSAVPIPHSRGTIKKSKLAVLRSGTGDSPHKIAVANDIKTKDLLLEIPKIDQELAEKLSARETSVEKLTPMAAAPPVKRGRKKKVTEPTSPDKESSKSRRTSNPRLHKRKKEKHCNRSPHEDGSPAKEHKRKRKRRNHDMENLNDVPGGTVTSSGEDNRPPIKIKIKPVLDLLVLNGARFF